MRAEKKVIDVLVDSGIDHVFVYPGGATIPVINALYDVRDKIKVILTRNEQTASCMANVYGRLTGKPGVFIAQGPFAASTGLFGILESQAGSAPMVVLTDITDFGAFGMHAPAQCCSGEYGSIHLKDILGSTCKYVASPVTPTELVQGMQQAIKHALSGRPGPTAVLIRSSNLSEDIDQESFPRLFSTERYSNNYSTYANSEDIQKWVTWIKQASLPLMISGNGIHVSKAYEPLQKVAEAFAIPVVTSNMGKGTIDENHPLSAGVMGSFGHPFANQLVGEADLLIIVGCRLKPQDTNFENPKMIDPNRQKIVQIDIEPHHLGWNYPVDLPLCGDASAILNQVLQTSSPERADFRNHVRTKRVQSLKERDFEDNPLSSDTVPILPQRAVREIQVTAPPNLMVFTDGGNNRFWMMRFYRAKAGAYWGPGGTLAVSYGPPAAVVGKMLFPERPCLSVSGDGGLAMQIHVLSTAIQYRVPVVFLVFNDSRLGMVQEWQRDRPIGSEFIPTDFAAIARGFGCEGYRITFPKDLGPALEKAYRSTVPVVLDVLINREEKIYEKLYSPLAKEVMAFLSKKNLYYG
jgi:acetolactate synthase-1/2/3 large subunit